MIEPFVVASVVEGDGEVVALPVLLRRMTEVIDPGRLVDVRRPIRVNRGRMLKDGELERYVELAVRQHQGRGAVLVLLDADDDCAAKLGPTLQERAQGQRPGSPISVVLAVREFEAWFLAAASSLAGRRGLPRDLEAPPRPEQIRDAKGWLRARRTDGLAYAPTVDQPALAAVADLHAVRSNAASFDKFWREVERLLAATRG
jgi:hypothetical protein